MSIHEEFEKIRKQLDEANNVAVSVALFGQPGAGKSSIVNKMVGKNVTSVGVETDKTVEMHAYEVDGVVFTDLPGYGTEKFPKEQFFEKFDIQSFDLFLCVTSGKLHQADTEFFQELTRRGKVCLFVVNKHDEIWEDGVSISDLEKRKIDDIRKHVGKSVDVTFTSCRNGTGLDVLIEKIKNALPDAKKERWVRSATAYTKEFLENKRSVCEKYIAFSSAASAANAVNPIPGVDVAVDVSIILNLFKSIRDVYGLSDEVLDKLSQLAIPAVGQLANNVLKYAATEGIIMLLKNMVGRQALKTASKYVPFVGQAIAATLGYTITSYAGDSYLENCHDLAREILDKKIKT